MEKKKILIADDEERIVKLVSDFLNASGYETVCAADGKEALDIFNADNTIDLAIIDIMAARVPYTEEVEIGNLISSQP